MNTRFLKKCLVFTVMLIVVIILSYFISPPTEINANTQSTATLVINEWDFKVYKFYDNSQYHYVVVSKSNNRSCSIK